MQHIVLLFLLLPHHCCSENLQYSTRNVPHYIKAESRERSRQSALHVMNEVANSKLHIGIAETGSQASKVASSGQTTLSPLDSFDFKDEIQASVFEAEFVHKVYDVIAPHFSNTRHTPWPKVSEFLMRLEPGALIADVGCGNGKYLGINPRTLTLGSDRSAPLVALASQRSAGQEVCVADNLNLPYRHGSCDAVLSIAVLHHLSRMPSRLICSLV